MTRLKYNPYLDFLSGILLSSLIMEDNWKSLPTITEANVIGPYHYGGEPQGYVIVADSALNYYTGHCDMIVSDLDGPVDRIIERKNAVKVIHAHGDNIDRIVKVVPELYGIVLGTTQSIPVRNIRNIGGFTDGDRAVIMATIMGARKVKLYGFNWDDPVDEPRDVKKIKMSIGREIIEKLTNIMIEYMKE